MFPGGSEWVLIFLVGIIFFGAKRIPEVARSLGAAAREFRTGLQETNPIGVEKGAGHGKTREQNR
ncbi:MAG: twin-arginine translocase TatA/TatE family subunit [Candidatus Hydrogenedentota bacterium]|nr:MAG: twin-arginine translocase TatA/TatE family subunit [Candidatus Hydrogenedentota bacterium]